jgi:outer membrane receptor protein involved in Fe transport
MKRTITFWLSIALTAGLSLSNVSAAEPNDPVPEARPENGEPNASPAQPSDSPLALERVELERVEVVGVTPISGSGIPVEKIPANVQSVDADDLVRYQSLNLPDYLDRNLQGVTINNAQSNPFQPDVRFRGFTASPLLGLPQGLSVYLNGVRFNEPFGDTVNWDLIPNGAIERMDLHPGSDSVYGLNTLGGAIAIRTKTGFSAPSHHLRALYGAWERHDVEISSGLNNGSLGYFVDLRNFGEKGWRDNSNSKVNQGFGTFSWQTDDAELDLTLAGNEGDLNGNGAAPVQLLDINRYAVFTHPDNTRTALFLSSLDGLWNVTDQIELSGNVFYRRNRIKTFNGDDSDFEECEDPANAGLVCEEEGGNEEVVEDIDGNAVVASPSVLGGTNNFSQTNQESYGGSLQTAFQRDLFERENQLIVGGTLTQGVVNFEFDTELASLTPDRGTIGSGVILEEPRVRLYSNVRNWGLFFTDTFSVTEQLALTASGRYNSTRIVLEDRFGTELNGRHEFGRFNPAGGFTYNLIPEFSFYGRYSESSRAPTPVELSCADPDAPCKLPNAFVSDPPLEQVVATTFEGGFRGEFDDLLGGTLEWNAGFYHTTNTNDILFISAGNLTSEGFFDNVGQTRRQGVEAGVTAFFDGLIGNFDQWRFGLNYSWIDATFRNPFVASSPNNPSADPNGEIFVQAGKRLPGIPEHSVKISADVDLWSHFSLGVDMLYNGSQYFRGDEANLNDPVSGYVIFNLRGELRYNDWIALYGRVDNLFDRRYATFGLYGEADQVLGPAFDDPRFVSPGSPRAGWIGIKLSAL